MDNDHINTNRYCDINKQRIKILYILAIVFWIGLCLYFKLYTTKGWLILILPLIVFGIAIYNCECLCNELDEYMFKASYLSVGLILTLPLLSWMTKDYNGDINQFISVIILYLTFTLLTLIDVWVPHSSISIFKHLRSVFQTLSITLIIYAMITYFLHREKSNPL